MFRKIFELVLFLTVIISINSCTDPVSNLISNRPPDTHLTLFPDSVITPGSTLKKIAWWGDDPDGFVAGFRFTFDSTLPANQWGYTTNNDSTFLLSMSGNDTTFRFYVAAVDNDGMADPTPASNLYPTINTPPSVMFEPNTEIPDTIFPVATFKWIGTDPDGNQTIRSYYWSVNDTSHFHKVGSAITLMSLTQDSGLVVNNMNCMYLKAQDNAGAFSPTIRMPSDSTKYFYVKKVNAKVLLIKDMPTVETPTATSYYTSALDTVAFDELDIKTGSGKFIPKIVNPMFIGTLRLFPVVIWSANRGNLSQDNPNFDLAQRSLPFYTLSGGKLFFTTGFPNDVSSQGQLINFAPVDSLTPCTIVFFGSGSNLINSNLNYPILTSNALIQRVRGLMVPNTVSVIYKLPFNSVCNDSVTVAIKNQQNNPNIIFMSMPVYYLNGNTNNSKEFFRRILINEFGLN
jgi:hypothetical protein